MKGEGEWVVGMVMVVCHCQPLLSLATVSVHSNKRLILRPPDNPLLYNDVPDL